MLVRFGGKVCWLGWWQSMLVRLMATMICKSLDFVGTKFAFYEHLNI